MPLIAPDVFCLFSMWMQSGVQPSLNVSEPLTHFGLSNLSAAHKLPYLVLFDWIFLSRSPAQCLHYINSLS